MYSSGELRDQGPVLYRGAIFSMLLQSHFSLFHYVIFRRLTMEDRRRTGRYVAGGTTLAVILLAVHHILLRGAPTIAGICIPAIIMAIYVIWVLYSARRDRRKARLLASAMKLTEVIRIPRARSIVNDDARKTTEDNCVVTRDSSKQIIT